MSSLLQRVGKEVEERVGKHTAGAPGAALAAGARTELGLPLGRARRLRLIAGGPVFLIAPQRFRLALLALPARGPQAKLLRIAALLANAGFAVSRCKLKVVVTVRQCKHPERGMTTVASHVQRILW